jgi:hypothetical protein
MRRTMTVSAGLAAALLALAAMQFPNAALALNPQPEVPSKPDPDRKGKIKTKFKTKKPDKGTKHVPPSPIKR